MGILSRIFARPEAPEQRDAAGLILGTDPWRTGLGADASGRYLSATGAENLSAVLAATNAIASGVASLAPLAFRRDGAGRAELPPSHWFSRLLRAPSEHHGWCTWAETMTADCALFGNALAELITDPGGRIVGLEPVSWSRVAVQVLPSGRIAYDIAPHDAWHGSDRTRRLLADQALHVRDRVSGNELVAKSRLQRAAGAVRNVASLQAMSEAVWERGVKPSGIVSAPQVLSTAQRSLMDGFLQRFRGAQSSGQVIALEAGWTFSPTVIDAESAQTLESRRFGTEEIARLFQLSPIFLQDWSRSTFTNSETAGRWHGQYSISPWVRRLESAVQRAVLGPHSDITFELDMSSLLRGSDLERWQTWDLATKIGAVSADEVRQAESWPPRTAAEQPQPAPQSGEAQP